MTVDGILETTLRRPLSLLESWFALSSMTIRYTLEVEGVLDLDALRGALSVLLQENPVLGGRFVPGRFEQKHGLPSLDLVTTANPVPLVHERNDELSRADHDQGLAHVEVARRGDRTLVSFAAHHAVADGTLSGHLHQRLWSHYTDIVEGRLPVAEPRPAPKSPESLLAERSVPTVDSGAARLRRAIPLDLPEKQHIPHVRERIRLSPETTRRLRDSARTLGETLHTLVAGAIAVVERRRLPAPEDGPVDLIVDSPVDWRTRLDPPAQAWEVTNALGSSLGVVRVGPHSDPAELGARLREQLLEDVRSQAVYQGVLRFEESLVADQPKIPLITATNIGVVGPFRTPRGVRVRDFRGFVNFDGSAIAGYLSARGLSASNRLHPLYVINSFDDRLSVELDLLLDPEASRSHAEELEKSLEALAGKM